MLAILEVIKYVLAWFSSNKDYCSHSCASGATPYWERTVDKDSSPGMLFLTPRNEEKRFLKALPSHFNGFRLSVGYAS